MTDYRITHQDNMYMNVKFRNNTSAPVDIISTGEDRNDSLVKKADLYYLNVESFSIPNKSLPIFVFDNEDGKYSVTVTGDVGTFKEDLVFEDRGNLTGDGKQNIYYIRQFLIMLNDAIDAANTAAHAVPPAPPEMELREDGRFEFVFPAGIPVGTIYYFSTAVYELFEGLEAIFKGYNEPDNANYEIFEEDPGAGGTLIQEEKSQYAWSDVTGVYLFTDLPIAEENFSNRLQSGADEKFKIINDFIPFQKADGGIDRTPWVFTSDFPKLIDLKSDQSIDRVSFTVSALRKDGSLVNVKIAPGGIATMKVRFAKKSLFNNEYNLYGLEKHLKKWITGREEKHHDGMRNSNRVDHTHTRFSAFD